MLHFSFFLSFPGLIYPQAEVELSIEDFTLMFEILSHGLAKCKICCKIVTDMERHHKSHAFKKYRCPLCPLSLTRADNLKRHLRMKHKLTPEQISSETDGFTTQTNSNLFGHCEEKWSDFIETSNSNGSYIMKSQKVDGLIYYLLVPFNFFMIFSK